MTINKQLINFESKVITPLSFETKAKLNNYRSTFAAGNEVNNDMTEAKLPYADKIVHGMAVIDAMTRIHYVEAGEGEQAIVLLHGFPQTWWEWRFIIPELIGAGFRVIVPDYRGAGDSWRPASGYDKRTMASDIHKLLTGHLKLQSLSL